MDLNSLSASLPAAAWVALDVAGYRGKALQPNEPPSVREVMREAPERPLSSADLRRIASWTERITDHGVHVLPLAGAEAGRLARAPGRALCVYARGDLEVLHERPVVAVVGSREATSRGLDRAEALGGWLGARGVVVASGGALGVDYAAHVGSVEAGGASVAILGAACRFSSVEERPPRMREVADRAAARGARWLSLTPHGPGTRPGPKLFVSRNRYIAAVADAVVVVEAGESSGALHTVDAARRLGVPVWAVPGDPSEPLAAGTNTLIARRVAEPLLSWDALLSSVGGHQLGDLGSPQLELPMASAGPPVEHPVLDAVLEAGGWLALDELAGAGAWSMAELLDAVTDLELAGVLVREGAAVRARRR